MDGWQHNQDPRFDEFVQKQRSKERFEGFDQRVERAFLNCSMLHKAEVTNGFKRHLKTSDKKFDATVLREMNVAIEGRLEWLREVWSQIDADYRCSDAARQEAATEEINKAIAGEPSDFMAWAYERKKNERTKGPKGKATMDAEAEDSNLPQISHDEANRYLNLKINMLEIERRVKSKYGIAGQQHWAMLQQEKDLEYEEKIDRAAEVYKTLIDQDNRRTESVETFHLRNVLERTHEAKVRFKAAMEMENERERLLEAHNEMQEERKQVQSERRKAQLKEAAELRMQGKTTTEVATAMKLRALDEQVLRQDADRRQERREVERKKGTFLDMIEKLRRGAEMREGTELMRQSQSQRPDEPSMNAFGFSESDAIDEHDHRPQKLASSSSSRRSNPTDVADPMQLTDDERRILQDAVQLSSGRVSRELLSRAQAGSVVQTSPAGVHKQELWRAIHADKYEDPFTAVHQARLDADKNYDQAYSKMNALDLTPRKGKKGMGEFAAGGERERFIFQGGGKLQNTFQWENPHGIVHNLDADGDKEYFLSDAFHVRDKKTGDIDWRFERKGGGAVLRGPRLYKIGERREMNDPSSKTMDPLPRAEQTQGMRKKGRRRASPTERSE
ncbi:Hypothetical protein, putative [Bodo saltans]|uniref:Uncharacterized protein n=1 Tax=Bodo saltans TaxID=75058 RepID=A0A0S4KMX4_BODSA|nr:Hypothetical protein, putative [Bodo saltans]|eukprot:CUI14863.1 Hypothetical protein, putative [Bodo saltans]